MGVLDNHVIPTPSPTHPHPPTPTPTPTPTPPPPQVKRQTAYVIVNYLYAIWLYRAITINDGVNASRNGYIHIFKASMKYLPYDNG